MPNFYIFTLLDAPIAIQFHFVSVAIFQLEDVKTYLYSTILYY